MATEYPPNPGAYARVTYQTIQAVTDQTILTSWNNAGQSGPSVPRSQLVPLTAFVDTFGCGTPDAIEGLSALNAMCCSKGWDLRITDFFRSFERQAKAYAQYQNWLRAGKPAPGTPEYNPKTMRTAYAGPPGPGYHQSGRAIDIDEPSLVATVPLATFREEAAKLGWTWINGENWHFDYRGDWQWYYDRSKEYNGTAVLCTLDVGFWDVCEPRAHDKAIQAQLQRAGGDCGEIDGYIGPKTEGTAAFFGIDLTAPDDVLFASLFALPTAARLLYSWQTGLQGGLARERANRS